MTNLLDRAYGPGAPAWDPRGRDARMLQPRSVFWPADIYPGHPDGPLGEWPEGEPLELAPRWSLAARTALAALTRLRDELPEMAVCLAGDSPAPARGTRHALFARRSETWPVAPPAAWLQFPGLAAVAAGATGPP